MHQTQGMTNLVGCCITDRLAHHIIIEDVLANSLVYSCSLDESPVVQQGYDVVIPDDIGGEDLASTRVFMTWTHGIGGRRNCILEAVVAHIVWIEVWIVLGIVFSNDGILETSLLESLVPVFYTRLDGFSPLLREGRIDIEHDRFLWLYQFAGKVLVHILGLGLQAPSVDVGLALHLVLGRTVYVLVVIEETHSVVLVSHRHRILGQDKE